MSSTNTNAAALPKLPENFDSLPLLDQLAIVELTFSRIKSAALERQVGLHVDSPADETRALTCLTARGRIACHNECRTASQYQCQQ